MRHLLHFGLVFGFFEYTIIFFGLCNEPASFQHYISDTLRKYLDIFYVAYFDDILINSEDEYGNEVNVKNILR